MPAFAEGACTLCASIQVIEILEEKGISAFNEIPQQGSGTVLIRAHGVPPRTKDQLADVGFKVIDATCPRVIKVQTIIQKHTKKGYAAIIVGDKNHGLVDLVLDADQFILHFAADEGV